MISTLTAPPNPLRVEARTKPRGIFQTRTPARAVTSQARGMALVAGQRMPTMSTRARAMGSNAIRANNPRGIFELLFSKGFLRGKTCCASLYSISNLKILVRPYAETN
jgi:hypothetical protein